MYAIFATIDQCVALCEALASPCNALHQRVLHTTALCLLLFGSRESIRSTANALLHPSLSNKWSCSSSLSKGYLLLYASISPRLDDKD